MNLLELIVQYLRGKQQPAQGPAIPPALTQQMQPIQTQALPGQTPLPVTPIVNALTNGGGLLNQVKDITKRKQSAYDVIDRLSS